jgi:hypothetical protein
LRRLHFWLSVPLAIALALPPPARAAEAADAAAPPALIEVASFVQKAHLGQPVGGGMRAILLLASPDTPRGFFGPLLVGKGIVVSYAGIHFLLPLLEKMKQEGTKRLLPKVLVAGGVAFLGFVELFAGIWMASASSAEGAMTAPPLPTEYYLFPADLEYPLFDGSPNRGSVGYHSRLAKLYTRLYPLSTGDLLYLDELLKQLCRERVLFPDVFLLRGYVSTILAGRNDEAGLSYERGAALPELAADFAALQAAGRIAPLIQLAGEEVETCRANDRCSDDSLSNSLFLTALRFHGD